MTPPRLQAAALLFLAVSAVAADVCPLGGPADDANRRIVTCRPELTLAQCRARAKTIGCTILRDLPLAHAVLVLYPEVKLAAFEAKSTPSRDIERIDSDRRVHWLAADEPFKDAASAADEILQRISALRADAVAARSSAGETRIPWGVRRVGAPEAWPRSQGAGADIGVIDTGIEAQHADLAGQVVGGVNVSDALHPEKWQDDEGHGTHVSGTIAAKGLSGGIAGVAPKARLYAIKVLDKNGNGTFSDLIAGLQWAIDHKIPIVNMSLGASEDNEPFHRAIKAAAEAGITIIAAAGNTGSKVSYPGAYPEVIAVAAADESDHVAPFSSRGPQVAFIAPGVDVESAKMGGGYVKMSGTSMATPHITGLAALAYAAGARTPIALRETLDRAARPIGGLTPDLEGRGMVLAGNLIPAQLLGEGVQLAMAH